MKDFENSKLYLEILYAIFTIISYYAKLFRIIPEDSILGMDVDSISDTNGTHIRVTVPRIENENEPRNLTTGEMQEIINEYLIFSLPQTDLPVYQPARGGRPIEALWCESVTERQDHTLFLEFLWIDSPTAEAYFRRKHTTIL